MERKKKRVTGRDCVVKSVSSSLPFNYSSQQDCLNVKPVILKQQQQQQQQLQQQQQRPIVINPTSITTVNQNITWVELISLPVQSPIQSSDQSLSMISNQQQSPILLSTSLELFSEQLESELVGYLSKSNQDLNGQLTKSNKNVAVVVNENKKKKKMNNHWRNRKIKVENKEIETTESNSETDTDTETTNLLTTN